jgi:hypothetical protein
MDELETATVVEGDASATVSAAAKKPKARGAPKWETEARDRLKAAIRRYSNDFVDDSRSTSASCCTSRSPRSPRALTPAQSAIRAEAIREHEQVDNKAHRLPLYAAADPAGIPAVS